MSLDWTSSTETRENPNYADQPWLPDIGEVFNEPRPYAPSHTPIGLDYAHVCGTPEEFVSGVVYDPDRVVEFDEQGLPLCCGGPIVPTFGLVLGLELEFVEGPDPGPACSEAQEFTAGEFISFTVPGGESQWWRTELATGMRACFANPNYASTPSTMRYVIYRWDGTFSCPGGECLTEAGDDRPLATVFGNIDYAIAFVQVVNFGTSPFTYSVKLSSGPCF